MPPPPPQPLPRLAARLALVLTVATAGAAGGAAAEEACITVERRDGFGAQYQGVLSAIAWARYATEKGTPTAYCHTPFHDLHHMPQGGEVAADATMGLEDLTRPDGCAGCKRIFVCCSCLSGWCTSCSCATEDHIIYQRGNHTIFPPGFRSFHTSPGVASPNIDGPRLTDEAYSVAARADFRARYERGRAAARALHASPGEEGAGPAPQPQWQAGPSAGPLVAVHIRRPDQRDHFDPNVAGVRAHLSPIDAFAGVMAHIRRELGPAARFVVHTVGHPDELAALAAPDVDFVFGGDPLEAFAALADADALVMSKSSFSYAAALVAKAPDCRIYYTPFWSKPLSTWSRFCNPGAEKDCGGSLVMQAPCG